MTTLERYAFGGCALDVSERRLSCAGQAVALAPKAFDLLVALVRDSGHLVTKRELLERVWPQCSVDDGILAVHVSGLRKALGDSGPPARYIETTVAPQWDNLRGDPRFDRCLGWMGLPVGRV